MTLSRGRCSRYNYILKPTLGRTQNVSCQMCFRARSRAFWIWQRKFAVPIWITIGWRESHGKRDRAQVSSQRQYLARPGRRETSLQLRFFHRHTVFSGNSKFVGSNSMGFDSPSRHQLFKFIFNFARRKLNFSDSSGTKSGTVRILTIFNRLRIYGAHSSAAIYIYI